MARPRDLPHPGKREELVAMAKRRRGSDEDQPPQRPLITGLFEDLADPREPEPVFGQFPRVFIPKMLPWLKCARSKLLHICSGALPLGEGIRVDIRPEACPDYVADARALPFEDSSHEAAMLDPPYTEQYAKDLYGVEYPRPAHLLREAARVVKPGGRIAFVHYLVPMPPPGCTFITIRGLSMGFGFPMRAVTIFEKDQAELIAAPRVRRPK